MIRIEEIVRKLEQGGEGLDESIALFEEGTSLVKACQKELEKAELRVKKLIDKGGEKVEEDLFGELNGDEE
jgi:exodeoxyribonuclease VII small subunit